VDRLLALAAQTPVVGERAKIYAQVNAILARDLPTLILFDEVGVDAARAHLRNLWQGLDARDAPLLLGILVINFLLIALAPSDPVAILLGEYPAPPEYVARLRDEFGLDRPLYVRLGRYVANVLHGNLGFSFAYRVPVVWLVLERLGNTLLLMGTAMTVAALAGLLLGGEPHLLFRDILRGEVVQDEDPDAAFPGDHGEVEAHL
jgi:hypothetical protein